MEAKSCKLRYMFNFHHCSSIQTYSCKTWLLVILICTSGRNHNSCKVTQHPLSSSKGRDQSSISNIIIKIVRKMTVPVTVLHVTPMVAFRSDGHVGTWSDNPSVPDCSHWCLPGVPDMWNEILFSYLLPGNDVSLQWRVFAIMLPFLLLASTSTSSFTLFFRKCMKE